MPRTRLSKEARREQIIREACKLFAAKGFDSTTTKEIAEAVGVGETLIFHYFQSKDAIFQEIFSRWSKLLYRVRTLSVVENSAIETLRTFAENMLRNFLADISDAEREEVLFAAAVTKRENYDSQRVKAISDAPDVVSTTVLPVVIFGQINGEIRDGDPLELASAFFACVAGIHYLSKNYEKAFHVPPVDICLDLLRKERLEYKQDDTHRPIVPYTLP